MKSINIQNQKGQQMALMTIAIVLVVLAVGFLVYYVMTPTSSIGASSSPTSSSSTSMGTYYVSISNFAFSPSSLSINAGETVVWTNKDNVPHTVSSDSGSELSSPTLSPGDTYSHTFGTAGSYSYHCNIHPNMKGSIIVSNGGTSGASSSSSGSGY